MALISTIDVIYRIAFFLKPICQSLTDGRRLSLCGGADMQESGHVPSLLDLSRLMRTNSVPRQDGCQYAFIGGIGFGLVQPY